MPPKNQQFMLVRWLVDESVGIMPLTCIKKNQSPRAGAFVDAKYQGKFYEAEILKISSESYTLVFAIGNTLGIICYVSPHPLPRGRHT